MTEQRSDFFRHSSFLTFPGLFPDLREISLTSRNFILVETETVRLNLWNEKLLRLDNLFKGAGRSADLKINKSAPVSLNHHTFSNTETIYTKQSFMESLLNYLAFGNKNNMVD